MAWVNGRLSASQLAPIAGGGYLAKQDYRNPSATGPAAAWNEMAAHIYEQTGVRIQVTGPDSAYRSYDRQVYYWNLYLSGRGNLAARPGTSNHGFGINVDVPMYVRTLIDKYGAQFGWSKSWSDAPTEWWHITYQTGHYSGKDPGPGYSGAGSRDRYPTLRRGRQGEAVKRAQKHLARWNLGITRPKVDGDFGKSTAKATRQFQVAHHLKPDGVIGRKTWAALRRKDHFLDDERTVLNRLALALRHGVADHERDRVARLRAFAGKRAAAIRARAKKDGWDSHHRPERFRRLRHAADPGSKPKSKRGARR